MEWDCQIPGCIFAYEDVAADFMPHGLSGMLHSQKQDQDLFPSVAAEVTLVSPDK